MLFELIEYLSRRSGLKDAERRYAQQRFSEIRASDGDVAAAFGQRWAAEHRDVLQGVAMAEAYWHLPKTNREEFARARAAELRKAIRRHFGA